ncbi:hypothetical protein CrV_gp104 [Cylindrospermopsis raciborskii virus RM-2018a]|jgi:hypothetical protein|nr:hypothetical protein CrV_gp087 [Cylindrospermopsis raciborskii virus RM-2018a]AXK90514.1 hypothetical protein CrV_gp104 [Cylindrospermopsis raciborskii virus RM-2018a]
MKLASLSRQALDGRNLLNLIYLEAETQIRLAGGSASAKFAHYNKYQVIAYGIGWADDTSRTDGILSLALRKKEVVLKAVKAMHKRKKIDSYYEVAKWLTANQEFLLTP